MAKNEKRIKVCKMIADDMEKDVKELEGQPFTGHNVSCMFGKQAAAIRALANIVQKMLEDDGE